MSVAVIDIGSNSIKTLVAERAPDGTIRSRFEQTLDARISEGISRSAPRLTDESMQRGVDAVRALVSAAAPLAPERVVIVATSAVRDAANGPEFSERIRAATGEPVRLLSGAEEAALIGRGLTCDPALRSIRDFYVFDLGGGSLECLAFRDRAVQQAVSLQLGCVRLHELFVGEREMPLPAAAADRIRAHVQQAVRASGFAFSLPSGATAVGTGGTVTTARAVRAARAGRPLEQTDTLVPVASLRALGAELGALPLAARRRTPGLPTGRADVFPTALVTLVALADAGGFAAYRHSFYNLRFGLAAEALGAG